MSLSYRVVKDHACGGMISYAGELHEEVSSHMRSEVGSVALTDL